MASSSSAISPSHEALFNASKIELHIPNASDLADESEDGPKDLHDHAARKVAFLDEKLLYFVTLVVLSEHLPSSSTSPPPELLRFLSCLQLTVNSSFIPPLPTKESSFSAQQAAPPATLAPPDTASTSGPLTPSTAGLQPYTPNPFPSMKDGEGQYAGSEGVTVWEGAIEMTSGKFDRRVSQVDSGWKVQWRGEVPVAYVRTQIQDPLLSVTLSVTLREAPSRSASDHEEGNGDEHVASEDNDDLAGMEEIDLLGGLANGGMPTSRLAQSIQQDFSLPLSHDDPQTAVTLPTTAPTTSTPAPNIVTPSTSGPSRQRGLSISVKQASRPVSPSTLRKSYRRVLSLSSGLRVRMRTLFLPQLLAPSSGTTTPRDEAHQTEGERRIALCVEMENPLEADLDYAFDIESVVVDIGGKGGKATAELNCQPEQLLAVSSGITSPGEPSGVFPLRLKPVEQYNLLYVVSIASAPEDRSGQGIEEALSRDMGKGDEQRPVAIMVTGRPYSSGQADLIYPTKPFQSRWNCTLDLAPFYASLNAGNLPPPVIPEPSKSRNSKTISSPPNALVGDKRYSLSTLLASKPANQGRPPASQPQARISSMASVSQPGSRVASYAPPREHSGLLMSVKVLPPDGYGKVQALEAFSIEVFVHNRTEEVRRFRLSVPGREVGGRVREVWEKRRQRGVDEASWGVDDPVLRQLLLQRLSSAPALVPLENDVRCGPLYPGASMSARMRLLPLREGVHKLEKLRVTGVNEDFDFIMSPVLDVVVGPPA